MQLPPGGPGAAGLPVAAHAKEACARGLAPAEMGTCVQEPTSRLKIATPTYLVWHHVSTALTNYTVYVIEPWFLLYDHAAGSGEWSEWSLCSRDCNGGVRFRSRLCDTDECDSEQETCNTQECNVENLRGKDWARGI